MNNKECANRIIETFPEYRELLLQHIEAYGDVLLHIFVIETINVPLVPLLEQNLDAKKYCDLIESMWEDGDDLVRNVVDVTILERLSDDDVVWQRFGKNISQGFKDDINNEVLVQNMMMAHVKPLKP